jgi:hypothetical protein
MTASTWATRLLYAFLPVSSISRVNTTHGAQLPDKFDATAMYAALEARLEALEKVVHQAKTEDLEDCDGIVGRTVKTVRRGPKPRFRREDFNLWRDLLVEMLESNWPEIEPTCVPMVDATATASALEVIAHKSGSQHQLCAEHLLQNSGMILGHLPIQR